MKFFVSLLDFEDMFLFFKHNFVKKTLQFLLSRKHLGDRLCLVLFLGLKLRDLGLQRGFLGLKGKERLVLG